MPVPRLVSWSWHRHRPCRSPGTEAEIRKKLKPVMGGKGFSGHKPRPVNRWSGKRHTAVMLKPRLALESFRRSYRRRVDAARVHVHPLAAG